MANLVKKLWCCRRKSFPIDIPKGYINVCVGKQVPFKFVLEANYLNHPLVENLLDLSVEEYGYSYDGALRIDCEVEVFVYLIELLKTRNPSAHYMELSDLLSKFKPGSPGPKESL
ncbi:hypothetical protein AMTRI_Chr03g138050 [Amborella trichopoda]|uniref:Uncharacterized protein n=1 Tax=Amborella trichopoda TaxID=13333 RepID=W1PN65_AMBTC|nr:auxin-induced protein X15 [Amborella trichopoda]ERN11472.1 hypothetical protein AMTR_s00022p00089900 [Amborella trichopoda]|eukprot:XP_006849891.1 auxin-induced protein X15 [Amborella trichopoda]